MENTGIFSLVGALLLAPFQLVGALVGVARAHAQRQRYLLPLERSLRRASHPVGVLAVLFLAHRLYGVRIDAARAAFAHNDWLAVGAAVAVVFGVALFIAGARHSAGMEDGPLATRAFFKLAGGIAAAFYIGRIMPWRVGGETPADLLAAVLLVVAVWCIATGAVRFVLLAAPMQAALAQVKIHIRDTQFSWDDEGRRRWWQFWRRWR
jgi:hypothetical protein